MRGMRPGLGGVVSALLLGACGTASAEPDRSTAVAAPPAPAATTTQGPRQDPGPTAPTPPGVAPLDSPGPVFPITLRRTGGIAGYADTVVLESTGKVLVETRRLRGRVCLLAKPQQEHLFALLATLRTGGPAAEPSPPAGPSDPAEPAVPPESEVIRISLTDSRNQLFDLTDPSLGSVSGLVGGLVSDVTLTSPSSVRCTTPRA